MNRQSGEVRFGTVVWLLMAVVIGMICIEAIPVKIRASEFQDFMIETAKFAARQSDKNLHKRVLDKAIELDLPVDPKALEIKKTNGRIRIRAEYTIPLEFPFYTYQWTFKPRVDRPIFII